MKIEQRSARAASPLGPLHVFSVEAKPETPPPPDVIGIVDLSGSLVGPPGARALAAARDLLAALPDERRGALLLAASPPLLVAPLGPLGPQRAALAAPRDLVRGANTLARAIELAALEGPAVLVVFSDLAWGHDVPAALARLGPGVATIVVQTTSAFTPSQPVRAARFAIDGETSEAARRALADSVRASEAPLAAGTLTVELEGDPPLAWFAGDERSARGSDRRARVPLREGAARLAFVTASPPAGRVVLASGGKPLSAALRAEEALEGADALVRAALEQPA